MLHAGSQLLKTKYGRDKDSALLERGLARINTRLEKHFLLLEERKKCWDTKGCLIISFSSLVPHLDKTRANSAQLRADLYLFAMNGNIKIL